MDEFPSWAYSAQKDSWKEQGLIISDEETQTILNLTPAQALSLLTYITENHDWEQSGFIVGVLADETALDDIAKWRRVLHNPLSLKPLQISNLKAYLEANQDLLIELKAKCEEIDTEFLADVYQFILSWPKPSKKTEHDQD